MTNVDKRKMSSWQWLRSVALAALLCMAMGTAMAAETEAPVPVAEQAPATPAETGEVAPAASQPSEISEPTPAASQPSEISEPAPVASQSSEMSESVPAPSQSSETSEPMPAAQQPAAPSPEEQARETLDARVQALKKDVKALNRDLFILEEELLFPSSTQLAVFLSVDVGDYFRLDSVQLKMDDKVVANHLYTPREQEALDKGGVQRLYMGNVKTGKHELVAVFTGPGPNDREYRRATTISFEKGSAVKYLELKIMDVSKTLQPEFVVKEWE